MTERRPPLGLMRKQGNTNDFMISANTALANHNPEEALTLYTKILCEVSPGHVCAFLNRSLCYLHLGHYELAAADAYRAALASYYMRDDKQYTSNARLFAQQSYLRAEGTQVNKKEVWTQSPHRYIGVGWAESPLAGIVVNEEPDISKFDLDPAHVKKMNMKTFLLNKREDICAALEVRAIYRLAGALYLCGGGARHDALGLIDDAVMSLDILQWELLFLRDLGDEIMADIVKETDDSSRIMTAAGVGHQPGYELSPISRSQRQETIKEAMRSRCIRIHYHGYQKWNKNDPDLSQQKWQKVLQSWVRVRSKDCSPHVIDVIDRDQIDARPRAQLVATRDIESGDLILSAASIFNVTTNDSRKNIEDPEDDEFVYQFCDTCATFMVFPMEGTVRYKGPEPSPKATSSSSPISIDFRPPIDSPQPSLDLQSSGAQQKRNMRTPPSDRAPSHIDSSPPTSTSETKSSTAPEPDVHFCSRHHLAPLCSVECASKHRKFDHQGLCGSNLETAVLRENLGMTQSLPVLSCDQQKIRSLHDLMLLRVLAYSLVKGQSPLHVPELAFADAGVCGTDQSRFIDLVGAPWSFNNNIVRPIHILHRLCRAARTDPFTKLKETDGWMLNTIIVKIAKAMRVNPSSAQPPSSLSSSPKSVHSGRFQYNHFAKFYDSHGSLTGEYLPSEPRHKFEHDIPVTKLEAATRVGRMTTLLDMIRVADISKNEKANVRIEEREGLNVYAVGKVGTEIVIGKCEVLLRSAEKPGVDGSLNRESLDSFGTEDDSDGGASLHDM